MKGSDRAILAGVLVVAMAIGFYLFVLGPKRDEASKLNDQISQLHSSISQQEQTASFAEQARNDFPRYYGRLVVLGKAVPAQADTASMIVQLNSISGHSGISFRSIKLSADASGSGTSSSSASTTTPAPSTGTSGTTGSTTSTTPSTSGSTTGGSTATPSTGSGTTGSSTAAATPASSSSTLVPATESDAASLPIGAVVGPDGLPTLPYAVGVTGSFFEVADFLGGVDDLVKSHDATQVSADGRLLTVNGFALDIHRLRSHPVLNAVVSLTSYVAPSTEGLTGGASPSGPAPAPTSPSEPQAQAASAVVSK